MRLTTEIINFINFIGILNTVSSVVKGETDCPPPEDVQPCKCFNSPHAVLECENVNDVETLRGVFENSNGYTYQEVQIKFSSLQYLPHDMFENTHVEKLYFKNVTLVRLFSSPPEALNMLDTLFIENTRVIMRMDWSLLTPFTQLRLLTIYYNSIKTLKTDFNEYVTKELQQLSFYATETKKIEPGALAEFVNLDKIEVSGCKLTELTRDLFPRPFNVRFLYFNNNKIATIPEDLFTDMPNLHSLGLKDNLISVLPESAFGGRAGSITYFMFSGNPLKCDCLLLWLIKDKPEVLSGTCASPRKFQGRELKDLYPGEFNC